MSRFPILTPSPSQPLLTATRVAVGVARIGRGSTAYSASSRLEEGPPGIFSVKWLGGRAARHIQRQMAWRKEGPPGTFSVKWLGGGRAARHIQRQMAWRRKGRQAHSASNGLEGRAARNRRQMACRKGRQAHLRRQMAWRKGRQAHLRRQMAWRKGRQAHSASNGLEERWGRRRRHAACQTARPSDEPTPSRLPPDGIRRHLSRAVSGVGDEPSTARTSRQL